MSVRVAQRLGFQCITNSVVYDSESVHPKPSRLGTAVAGALVHTSSVCRGSVGEGSRHICAASIEPPVGMSGGAPPRQLTGRVGRSANCGLESLLEPEPETLCLWLSGNFQAELEKLK